MRTQPIIDWFLPDDIKKNDDLYIRLSQLILFCFIACPVFFIPNIIKWKNIGSTKLAISMAFVTILITASPFIIKYIKSVSFFSNYIFAVLSWHFLYLCVCTGGIYSSALTWNLVIPVFAAAFGGYRSSFIWAGVMLLEIGCFIYLDMTGFQLSGITFTKEQIFEVQISNIIGPLLALVITMFFAEKSRESAYAAQSLAQVQTLMTEKKSKAKTDQYANHLQAIFTEIDIHSQNLNAEIQEISKKIKQSAQYSVSVDQIMKKSDMVVTEAQQSMRELTDSMEKIAVASENTSKILKTIDEIAFQTNLLALNAAVEAARAGDAGSGFAVVADEVRNLAMRSAKAAKNTSELIHGTEQTIGHGSKLVSKTDDAFSQVAKSVKEVAALIEEISKSSSQQNKGIEEINETVAKLTINLESRHL